MNHQDSTVKMNTLATDFCNFETFYNFNTNNARVMENVSAISLYKQQN